MSDEFPAEAYPAGTSFRLHSPAIDFIENKVSGYHPGLDTQHLQFDPSVNRFVPRMLSYNNTLVRENASKSMLSVPDRLPPSQQVTRPVTGLINEMGFWNEVFPKAMEMLQEDPIPSGLDDSNWGIRRLSKWADVQAKLEMAQRDYEFQNDSRHVGGFRRAAREKFDKHAVTIKQAARLVPDVDLAKPVIGAVHVVVDAYRKSSEVREDVIKSFEDLPRIFENIDSHLRTYPKDQNIIRASCYLVRSIFKAIEYALAFFTSKQVFEPQLIMMEKPVKRASVAVLTGSEYQKLLRDCLTDMRTCCEALKEQAGMSLAHRVTSDNQHMMHQNDTLIHESQIAQRVLGMILPQVQVSTLGIQYIVHGVNHLYSIFQDRQTVERMATPSPRSASPLPQLIEQQPSWSPQAIWARLRMPTLDVEDLTYVVERIELILHEDRGKTQQLFDNHVFGEWLGLGGSTRLLVQGDFRVPHDISPLSAICTILSYTFRSLGDRTIGLVFFCGRHQTFDDYQGGGAMMRSLIAQLMTQFSFDSVPPSTRFSLQDLEGNGVHVLCDLFALLMHQLPTSARVFCLVDGISLYEKERFLEDMSIAIMSLVDMVDDLSDRSGPTFKLLITSPQPTSEVRRVFDSEFAPLLDMRSWPMAGGNMSMARMQDYLGASMS